ncbi:MAG TPA: hypothetical protein IGS37_01275 [Synechococcales cyanobacterium M55_K2018_004]|nr:hypothetical protein [Synechococcales cyanobacterium M55_K2018_004]
MAIVIFYEKPGCINNAKQKALLQAAGHSVESRNLLTTNWTIATLRPFFGALPVAEWFNPSAPAIKEGTVNPAALDAETAIALMLENPLLIRRPLMQVGQVCKVGFDVSEVNQWIGLEPMDPVQRAISDSLKHQDLQTCPQMAANRPSCSDVGRFH